MPFPTLLPLLLALALVPAGQPEAAKPDPRFDPVTGRSLANWPPAPLFDHEHLLLDIDIADMEAQAFTATASLRVRPLGRERREIALHAGDNLTISAVTVNGTPARFEHRDGRLTITLPSPASPGTPLALRIAYAASNTSRDGNGLIWLRSRRSDDGSERQPAIIYSQGQAENNHLWFPCHDFPDEKLTTEIRATVPDGYEVLSNGRLVTPSTPAPDGRRVWHWLQDKPHSAYLVTFVVGKYEIVELGGPDSARPGLPVPVYGYPGTADTLRRVFANTPAMIAFFERYFDEPYPWDKYAQVLVRNFRWGGMENTSATTLADFAGRGRAGDFDDLIAHELAHQWMGDLVTCRSWEHLWLNEGWATFSEWLWTEHTKGEDAYFDAVAATLTSLGATAKGVAPRDIPVVSPLYTSPDDPFEKADNPYPKGGLLLHMLRQRLGDQVFITAVRTYIDRFKFDNADTDDFRRVLEETSGQSLERFFGQWAYRPGLPRLAVDLSWDEPSKSLRVALAQTQTIDADNPAYALRVPIWLDVPGSPDGRWVHVDIDTRSAERAFPLPAKPSRVRIDPHTTNAAIVSIKRKLD
ncbi:MAG: M1 family metallopeptidase [Phycisphaerae bacterium]|nr:M1 family metallopeptidase [Phycisphaerae bacterium]